MDYIDPEEFARKYVDTHKGMSVSEQLVNGRKGSLVRNGMTKKEMANFEAGKKVIEKKALAERADDFSHYVLDAASVRSLEILDQEKMPIDKLLNLVVRTVPQQGKIEHTGTVAFTFADMVKQASLDIETYDTVEHEQDQD